MPEFLVSFRRAGWWYGSEVVTSNSRAEVYTLLAASTTLHDAEMEPSDEWIGTYEVTSVEPVDRVPPSLTAEGVLREFISDIDAAGGRDSLESEWFDLQVTYDHAKTVLAALEG